MANASIPRSEYPRPNLVRKDWLCLNGEWDFEIDNARVGYHKDYQSTYPLSSKITVPFCPESKLSGIGHTDFMTCVWYKREVEIPKSFLGKRVILHIDACDWETTVYVGGKVVKKHIGGYTPIVCDITDGITDGKALIAIEAFDDVRSGRQLAGKQSTRFGSYGCFYTRTTGIWQSVWLEAVDPAYIVNYNVHTDINTPSVSAIVKVSDEALGKRLFAVATYEGKTVGSASCAVNSSCVTLNIALSEKHLWEVGCGRLYDLALTLCDGECECDRVDGYFGLRSVTMNKRGFFINGEYVFGRFVLDQGFYPDGIYTASSDEALRADIEYAMALGFNGARLHQKVFEPRFLYHADKLGYMLFDETGNWGWDWTDEKNIYTMLPEWIEEMERDMAHPAVIGWCPFNETWDNKTNGTHQCEKLQVLVYNVTRSIDPTRPCVVNSGSLPIYDISGLQVGCCNDIHDYTQDPEAFAKVFEALDTGVITDQLYYRYGKNRMRYDTSKSMFVSEYGGIGWCEDGNGWGYGKSVASKEEFLERLEGLTAVLRENPECCAICYTQLYDVEQEQNGLLTYDRRFKFPAEKIYPIFAAKSVKERK
ncbi:MAG: beta-galactosidase [Clostridia bacterium]|nr:beta-galactosidase [Clostridia bacterium]